MKEQELNQDFYACLLINRAISSFDKVIAAYSVEGQVISASLKVALAALNSLNEQFKEVYKNLISIELKDIIEVSSNLPRMLSTFLLVRRIIINEILESDTEKFSKISDGNEQDNVVSSEIENELSRFNQGTFFGYKQNVAELDVLIQDLEILGQDLKKLDEFNELLGQVIKPQESNDENFASDLQMFKSLLDVVQVNIELSYKILSMTCPEDIKLKLKNLSAMTEMSKNEHVILVELLYLLFANVAEQAEKLELNPLAKAAQQKIAEKLDDYDVFLQSNLACLIGPFFKISGVLYSKPKPSSLNGAQQDLSLSSSEELHIPCHLSFLPPPTHSESTNTTEESRLCFSDKLEEGDDGYRPPIPDEPEDSDGEYEHPLPPIPKEELEEDCGRANTP